jgi:hypothetical protein
MARMRATGRERGRQGETEMAANNSTSKEAAAPHEKERKRAPELYGIVVECRDEAEQRELFERLRREGVKVRLLVL